MHQSDINLEGRDNNQVNLILGMRASEPSGDQTHQPESTTSAAQRDYSGIDDIYHFLIRNPTPSVGLLLVSPVAN